MYLDMHWYTTDIGSYSADISGIYSKRAVINYSADIDMNIADGIVSCSADSA